MSVSRFFHLLLITCLSVSVAFMVGCTPEYEVEVQADPEDAGEIEGEGTYEEGEKAKVQLDIEEGYKFKGWYEDEEKVSQDQEYEFEIEENKELVAEFEEVINIPDENLEAAIKEELRVEQISNENIKELTSLEAKEEGVSDLNNLGKAENLKKLNLPGNKIQDIAALTELRGLEKLNLSNNEITDIKALHELTNLKEINLAENEVDEISFLKELSDLEKLSLSDNDNMRVRKVTLVDFDQSPGGDYIAYRVKSELPLTRDVQVVNINENVSIEQVFEPNVVTEQGEFYSFAELFPLERPFTQRVANEGSAGDRFKGYSWAKGEDTLLVTLDDKDIRENKEKTGKEEGGVYKLDLAEKKIVKVE